MGLVVRCHIDLPSCVYGYSTSLVSITIAKAEEEPCPEYLLRLESKKKVPRAPASIVLDINRAKRMTPQYYVILCQLPKTPNQPICSVSHNNNASSKGLVRSSLQCRSRECVVMLEQRHVVCQEHHPVSMCLCTVPMIMLPLLRNHQKSTKSVPPQRRPCIGRPTSTRSPTSPRRQSQRSPCDSKRKHR